MKTRQAGCMSCMGEGTLERSNSALPSRNISARTQPSENTSCRTDQAGYQARASTIWIWQKHFWPTEAWYQPMQLLRLFGIGKQ